MKKKDHYYDLFEDKHECVITHWHMFDAVRNNPEADHIFTTNIIEQTSPLFGVVTGSSFKENSAVLNNEVLSPRNNGDDKIIILDIDPESLTRHREYIASQLPHSKISLEMGDMNRLPISPDSVDFLVNDCAINFNQSDHQNHTTIAEVARVLKPETGICLFASVVNKKFDDPQYGYNQEEIVDQRIYEWGNYFSFKTLPDGTIQILQDQKRKAWPVNYYKMLFQKHGLNFVEFDIQNGKSFFPPESQISYRRFVLQKPR